MLKKFKRYLAKKLLPYTEVKPQKYEITSLDVETLSFVTFVSEWDLEIMLESVYKKEIARGLADSLIPHIKFEFNRDDVYHKSAVQIRGSIRIVKER